MLHLNLGNTKGFQLDVSKGVREILQHEVLEML